jgi:hypothetical protein
VCGAARLYHRFSSDYRLLSAWGCQTSQGLDAAEQAGGGGATGRVGEGARKKKRKASMKWYQTLRSSASDGAGELVTELVNGQTIAVFFIMLRLWV